MIEYYKKKKNNFWLPYQPRFGYIIDDNLVITIVNDIPYYVT